MKTSLIRTAVAAVLLLETLAGNAWAQQAPSTTGQTGNTLTGGAEAAPTDKATPAGPQAGAESGAQQQTSGSSASGNTMTGGAEGMPTDQGTLQGPATNGDAAAPAPTGTGTGGMPQQEGVGARQN